jgi:hypothetical protein
MKDITMQIEADHTSERDALEGFSDAVHLMLSANCHANKLEARIGIMAGAAGLAKFICETAKEGRSGTALREVATLITQRFELIAQRCDAYDAATPAERNRMEAEADFQDSAPAGRA